MNDLYEFLFKIILIGDWGVGKSNIILRFTQDAYDPDSRTTIGVEFSQKVMELYLKKIVVQIWDTAGQDRYKAITSAYYRAAAGAILVYDISKRSSFENLNIWIKEIHENTSPDTVVMLIGNKTDLKGLRAVSTEEGKEFAKQHGFLFEEVSALTGNNVAEAFSTVVSKVYKTNCLGVIEHRRPGSKLSFAEENHQNTGYCQKIKNGVCC